MPTAPDREDQRATPPGEPSPEVQFALDGFDVAEGRVVVTGRWYGVTGRRFVRPVLQVEGRRRLIAVLDHKPWAAEEGAAWLAAFAHDGHVGPSRLQVAPDIAVEIPPAGPHAGDGERRPARLARAPVRRALSEPEAATPRSPDPAGLRKEEAERTARLQAERDAAMADAEVIRQERDELRAGAARLRTELDQTRTGADVVRTELDHARADADRLRTEFSHARAEANTLRPAQEETAAVVEQLRADVARLRADADQAIAERNAAQAEVERLRRTPSRQPYIAPRPVAFRDPAPGSDWRVRAVAAVLVVVVLIILVQLLSAVF
jgi:cell division protein FtsB